jgi:biopolymer transport protein ExbB
VQAIWTYWAQGGWLLWPIVGVSFGIWAYGLRLRVSLQAALEEARRVETRLDEWFTGGDDTSAGCVIDGHAGRLEAAVAEAWGAIGTLGARERFERAMRGYRAVLQRDWRILKALTAAAPLLGLLGTVTGMVQLFTGLSSAVSEAAIPVAAGVRAALITTQYGLLAALPGVFGLLHLGRLRSRWLSTTRAIGMMLYTGVRHA